MDDCVAVQELAPPYVALDEFAKLHGIHPMQTRIARMMDWLWTARGIVKDGHPVLALGPYGQAQFFWLYREREEFRRCKECPHGVKESEVIQQASLF